MYQNTSWQLYLASTRYPVRASHTMYFETRLSTNGAQTSAPPIHIPGVVMLHSTAEDDDGYRTTFVVIYFDKSMELHTLGTTKVANRDSQVTALPMHFQALDHHYCSLGQSMQFYENCNSLGIDIASELLQGLRDIVFDPSFAEGFRELDSFTKSLIRYSEAEKAFNEAGQFFGRIPVNNNLAFRFTCSLEGFSKEHSIAIDFSNAETTPNRIVCFVGKNGTGKSGVLAKLAHAISGWDRTAGRFDPGRPSFSRAICVSYSLFQPFDVPHNNTKSYRYCGIGGASRSFDTTAMAKNTALSIRSLRQLDRLDHWLKLIGTSDLASTGLSLDPDDPYLPDSLSKLSSGHRIVVSVFSEILANIAPQSLLLLDEPELYLHPTLLSTFLRMLCSVLDDFDSYSIIATHSPIVVQEVPSRFVRVFQRFGSVPAQSELLIQSLGANLTELVDHLFVMNDDDKNYRNVLSELARNRALSEVLAMLGPNVTLNARMFLYSLYRNRGSSA